MSDTSLDTNLQSGNTGFSAHEIPVLDSGDYTLTVGQTVTGTGITAQNSFSQTLTFSVQGPRFSLAGNDILMAYPPNESLSQVENTLPCIFFRRNTLPWEREPAKGKTGYSWLAILNFFDSDTGKYAVENTTIGAFVPSNQRETGDDPLAPITIVKIDRSLATSILPSLDDLQWNAHVRFEDFDGINSESWNGAVVIAGSLPDPGKRTTSILVSLENCYNPDSGAFNYPSGQQQVQLAVLHSWGYTSKSAELDFTGLLSNPGMKPGPLRLPPVANYTGSFNPEYWLSRGFVPLPYHFRTGQSSGAWYHSPLALGDRNTQLNLPVLNADSLQIYDPQLGMYDASYASAWELGRMMALANARFVAALYAWKQTRKLRTMQYSEANDTRHLPVKNEQTRLTQLFKSQTAFYRLNNIKRSSTPPALLNVVTNEWDGAVNEGKIIWETDWMDESRSSIYLDESTQSYITAPIHAPLPDQNFSLYFECVPLNWTIPGKYGFFQLDVTDRTKPPFLAEVTIAEDPSQSILTISLNGKTNTYPLPPLSQGWEQIVLNLIRVNDQKWEYSLYWNGTLIFLFQDSITGGFFNQITLGKSTGSTKGTGGNFSNLHHFSKALTLEDITLISGSDIDEGALFQYFTSIRLLKGVPFSYLVPDEAMLPAESIRFFELDPGWINALLDGSFSPGRISQAQTLADQKSFEYLGLSNPTAITGILLRSAVVNGWPNLMVEASSARNLGTQSLPPSSILPILRMERLSEDCLLVLCFGKIATFDLFQHAQTLHFGVHGSTATNFTVGFRNIQGDPTKGNTGNDFTTVNFQNSIQRTISLNNLATIFKQQTGIQDFHSGTLGMELIQGSQRVRYSLQDIAL